MTTFEWICSIRKISGGICVLKWTYYYSKLNIGGWKIIRSNEYKSIDTHSKTVTDPDKSNYLYIEW